MPGARFKSFHLYLTGAIIGLDFDPDGLVAIGLAPGSFVAGQGWPHFVDLNHPAVGYPCPAAGCRLAADCRFAVDCRFAGCPRRRVERQKTHCRRCTLRQGRTFTRDVFRRQGFGDFFSNPAATGCSTL